jgi:hypothetical protein
VQVARWPSDEVGLRPKAVMEEWEFRSLDICELKTAVAQGALIWTQGLVGHTGQCDGLYIASISTVFVWEYLQVYNVCWRPQHVNKSVLIIDDPHSQPTDSPKSSASQTFYLIQIVEGPRMHCLHRGCWNNSGEAAFKFYLFFEVRVVQVTVN